MKTRQMIRVDMPDVLRIEQACFADIAWDEPTFMNVLRSRTTVPVVAEHHEQVVGFMVFELDGRQFNVLNLAVDPACQRRGVGTMFLRNLIKRLSTQHRESIVATVQESNLVAHLFLRSLGFRAVKVLRRLYRELDQDGYEFRYCVRSTAMCGEE